jgi:hypothetical protein
MTDVVDWLQTSYGRDAIAIARRARSVSTDPVAVANCLNRELDLPSSYRAAATLQAELQDRLIARWGEAPEWLLTWDGIEQATSPVIRKWRAARLAELGVTSIADLGSGLGFESATFNDIGMSVIAVERDLETAAVAKLNLKTAGIEFQQFDVVADREALDAVLQKVDAVFVDPARRDPNAARSIDGLSGNRVSNPIDWSPNWNFVLELAQRKPKLVAKIAPGIDKSLIPDDAHTVWFQHRGSLSEASVWFSGFGFLPGTTAIAVNRHGDTAELTSADPARDKVGKIKKFLLDPVGAVTRAGLVQQLAHLTNSHRIDEHTGYLSCDEEPLDSPLFTTFEVSSSFKFNEKKLASTLKELEARDVQIQTRGWRGDVDLLTRKLKKNLNGTNTISVLIARIGDEHIAIVGQRIN